MIADKINTLDACLVTFIDRIDNVETAIFKRNRPHIHSCIGAATAQINFTDPG